MAIDTKLLRESDLFDSTSASQKKDVERLLMGFLKALLGEQKPEQKPKTNHAVIERSPEEIL